MPRFTGNCWKCGTVWSGDSQPGRGDACPKCDFDLHSCKNCEHHDPTRHNECRIPETDLVRDREKSNFCEQFTIKARTAGASQEDPLEKARKRLDSLFGG